MNTNHYIRIIFLIITVIISCIYPQFIILFTAYILGSLPSGLLLGKLLGLGDIRNIGSGNIGATNALRSGNKKLAILTLLFDTIKGIIAIVIANYIYIYINDTPSEYIIMLSALLAIIGHMFPIWLNFKGGKGIATTWGIVMYINPYLALALLLLWVTVYKLFHYSSLSSITSTIFLTIYILLSDNSIFTISILCTINALIILKHSSNIKRLISGKELKVQSKE